MTADSDFRDSPGILEVLGGDASGKLFALPLSTSAPEPAGHILPERQVSQASAYALALVMRAGDARSLSLLRHPVTVSVWIEENCAARQRLLPSRTAEKTADEASFRIGPIELEPGVFRDLIGAVSLRFEIENDNGLSATLHSGWFFVEFLDDTEGQRLGVMLSHFGSRMNLLLPGDAATSELKGEDSGNSGDSAADAYLDLIERIILRYSKLHRFFETSARFRLHRTERLVSFSRLGFVDDSTLEFIATHPDELEESPEGVIEHEGQRFSPRRCPDVRSRKSFDIRENRCLAAFLVTVLTSLIDYFGEVENLLSAELPSPLSDRRTALSLAEDVIAPGLRRQHSCAAQLSSLIAAYCRAFEIDIPPALPAPPEPTSIFLASVPYRQLLELMHEWFAMPQPEPEGVRLLISVGKSSRLFELYVLALLAEAFGSESKRSRITWPALPSKAGAGAGLSRVSNAYVFRRGETEVTLFYEPVIAMTGAGGVSPTGLARTMSMSFATNGEPNTSPEKNFWTPDYVLKISDGRRSRYWIADAKHSAWPAVMSFYAKDVLFKYLLATAPIAEEDVIEGAVIFCGKSRSDDQDVAEPRRPMRDAAGLGRRTPQLELITLCAADPRRDLETLRGWLDELGIPAVKADGSQQAEH